MAVYTKVNDEDLSVLIKLYDIGSLLAYKGIAEGVENTNYLLQTTSGRFILTLYEKRVAFEDLPFFLQLIEHLSKNGIPCPIPVHSLNGSILQDISGRKAAIFSFLDGFSISNPKIDHCRQVGQALAELHLAANNFKLSRRNSLGQGTWRSFFNKFRARSDLISEGLSTLIDLELNYLDIEWPLQLPQGIIHADLFPDNVFFQNDRLSGLIDFYFACNDMLAYDLAICINAWCFRSDFSFDPHKSSALLDAYNDIRPMSENEKNAFPILARGAALRFLLTRAYDWLNRPSNALVSPHNPLDYLHRLKFHHSVHSFADYGYHE
ncbi:MAG: homoserine kinase [Hyphomicrobium sp.]